MPEEEQNDKFKLGKKWFWIGMAVALLNVTGGLVYGIALLIEKKHRKEGLIIVVFALVWAAIGIFVISPMLVKSGIFPGYTLMKFK